jgi:adenosine deaminase
VDQGAPETRVGLTLNLHTHLEGWLRPGTAAELAGELGIEAPAVGWAEAMHVSVPGDLPAFLERVAVTYPLLRSAAMLERVTAEAVVDAAADGCRFLELRMGPVLYASDALPLEEVMEALCRGLQRGIDEADIAAGLVPAVLRHHSPAANERLAELAVRYRGDGVVGFDIAGTRMSSVRFHKSLIRVCWCVSRWITPAQYGCLQTRVSSSATVAASRKKHPQSARRCS